MLIDVLTQVSADTGMEPVQKRAALLQLVNRGAKELHKRLECNKIYREVTLVVQPNAVVSLPAYIGELRGMRMHTNELPFDLHSLSMPRYINTTLQYKFKNWRDLGESATEQLPALVGPLTITTNGVESIPAQVTVSGQTNNSAQIEEIVTINASTVNTTNLFGPQIFSISCLTPRLYDITISDASGNELAVLYNNFKKTRYKIMDVSQIFWTLDSNDGGSLIDVLYKLPVTELTRDTDSFFAGDDYDEAWYNVSMFLYLQPLQNRQQDAMAYQQKFLNTMAAIKDSTEQGMIKKLGFGRNKFYGIFRKYRYFPGSVTNVDHNVQN